MTEIKVGNLECIKEDNGEEEYEKQWERSKIVFDHFYEYLKGRGLKDSTAGRRTEMAAFFIMDYVFVYEDIMDMREVYDTTIKRFLGNWYIRKFLDPQISTINSFLRAISDFYTFLHKNSFITKRDLEEIKEICKDKEWFEMRHVTYYQALRSGDEDEYYDWVDEYDYLF